MKELEITNSIFSVESAARCGHPVDIATVSTLQQANKILTLQNICVFSIIPSTAKNNWNIACSISMFCPDVWNCPAGGLGRVVARWEVKSRVIRALSRPQSCLACCLASPAQTRDCSYFLAQQLSIRPMYVCHIKLILKFDWPPKLPAAHCVTGVDSQMINEIFLSSDNWCTWGKDMFLNC